VGKELLSQKNLRILSFKKYNINLKLEMITDRLVFLVLKGFRRKRERKTERR